MELLESVGKVVWAVEKNEKKLMVKSQDATVIVSWDNPITSNVMDAAKGTLRGIVTYGVGYDFIDVGAATKRGLYVANCRGSNAQAVAELAVTLMLNISRRAHFGDRFIREGRWRSWKHPRVLKGKELAGKTLGLIGMGEIGRKVARIAKGFEMDIVVFDPYLSPETVRQAGAEAADLPSIMKKADYIAVSAWGLISPSVGQIYQSSEVRARS